jgi:hypothetical protein
MFYPKLLRYGMFRGTARLPFQDFGPMDRFVFFGPLCLLWTALAWFEPKACATVAAAWSKSICHYVFRCWDYLERASVLTITHYFGHVRQKTLCTIGVCKL